MTPDSLRAPYEALLKISDAIASHQSLPTLFRVLAPSLAKLMPFAGLGVTLYYPERRVTKLYVLESSTVTGIPVEQEFTPISRA